jgi:hypothetical protein
MGKRSNFERRKNDFYPTPYEAVLPLLPFLKEQTSYIEPCVGKGDLISHLTQHQHHCVRCSDLPTDATTAQYDLNGADCFITNPPWTRELLHPMIDNLRQQLPTWLLFDASWMHTKQARPYLFYCEKIVSIGRVKWISGSPHIGKDDSCWYLFVNNRVQTQFYGRK